MDKIPFKAIEKYRYGLRKTVSKHLKLSRVAIVAVALEERWPLWRRLNKTQSMNCPAKQNKMC